jgi:MFS transporter, ACS family, allantoate permease
VYGQIVIGYGSVTGFRTDTVVPTGQIRFEQGGYLGNGPYLSSGIPLGWTTTLGLTNTEAAGSTKKVTATAIGTIASIVHTFQSKDAPRYVLAKFSIVVLYFLVTVDLYIIRWLAVRENRKRDEKRAELDDTYVVEKNHEIFEFDR